MRKFLKSVKEIVCTIFGHSYYEGTITLALNLMPGENGSWHEIEHTSKTTICRRCGAVPIIGAVLVGTKDTHLRYSEKYSIDNLRLFLGGVGEGR